MGMFDDLVAEQPPVEAQPAGSMFDDLQPEQPEMEAAPEVDHAKMYEDAISSMDSPDIQYYKSRQERARSDSDKEAIGKQIRSFQEKKFELELLRQSNPYLAEEIENMPQYQKSLIAIGRGFQDVGRGLGLAGPEQSVEALESLSSQSHGAGGAGRALGQAAPFIPLAMLTGGLAAGLPQTAGLSAVGAAEGNVISRGLDQDTGLSTALGAAIPFAGHIPGAVGGIRSLVKKTGGKDDIQRLIEYSKPSKAVEDIGNIIKSSDEVTDETVDQMKRLIASSEPHPALSQIDEAIKKGGDDIAENIADAVDSAKYASTDKGLAKSIIVGSEAVDSPLGRNAIKEGWEEGTVAMLHGSSPRDINRFQRILNEAEKGLRNDKYLANNHPSKVIGKSILDRFKAVKSINKKSGAEINKIVNGSAKNGGLKGAPHSIEPAIQKFKDDLTEMGITIDEKTRKLNFDYSDIDNLPKLQVQLQKMVNRLNSGGRGKIPDAYDAHVLKGWADTNINYGTSATQGTGMTPKVERIIKDFRRGVNDGLKKQFPAYKTANESYSGSVDAIKEFQRLAGAKTDLLADGAETQVGILSRRILSNAQSREQVSAAIEELGEFAEKHGRVFDDDVASQVMFVSKLEEKMGSFSPESFKGGIKSALGSAAIGDTATATKKLAKSATAKAQTTEKLIKSMEALLQSKSTP